MTGCKRDQDDLEGKQHSRYRGIKRCADTGAGTRSNQRPNLMLTELETLGDPRSDSSADLNGLALHVPPSHQIQR